MRKTNNNQKHKSNLPGAIARSLNNPPPTLSNSVHTALAAEANVHLTDIRSIDDFRDVDLVHPVELFTTSRLGIADYVPAYPKRGAIRAINVGTVPAEIRFIAPGYLRLHTVSPGDTVEVVEATHTGWVRISPERVALNYRKFARASDGFSYIYFFRR